MSIVVEEKFGSPVIRDGRQPSVTVKYIVVGTEDEIEAKNALYAETPATFDLYGTSLLMLPRESVSIAPITSDKWDGEVVYGKLGAQKVVSFDTGGGSQRITNSLGTVGRYPIATAPDFHGAIGVTPDGGIEGVDIAVPVYEWVEQHTFASEFVTDAWRMLLFALTNRVNQYSFRNFSTGIVLFLGASGTQNGNGQWEISFRFAASPNITDQVIGEISGIAKKGWEYLWVLYEEKEDTAQKRVVRRPTAAYVEQVYQYGDFSLLGLGD